MPGYLLHTLVVTLALSTGFLAAKALGTESKLPSLVVGRLVINELEIRDPATGNLVGLFRVSYPTDDRRKDSPLLGLAIGPDLNSPEKPKLLLNVNSGLPEVTLI